jgi:CelD/BcsL family acetyltransferase involved in cellulose biosynthesis
VRRSATSHVGQWCYRYVREYARVVNVDPWQGKSGIFSVNVSVITSWTELEQLKPVWNQLLFRSRATSIFLTWEWLETWYNAIDRKVDLYVVTVRDDSGLLVGIAPFYRAQLRFLKVFQYRTLRYVADTATGAEYADWIADPDREETVCRTIADYLAAQSAAWDAIWLPNVAGWTGALERITQPLRAAGLPVHVRGREFSAVSLYDSLSAYEASIPAKRRKKMRWNTRHVASLDGITFVRCTDPEQLPAFLDALFDLHQRRWKSVGIDGSFRRKPVEEAFYRRFAEVALQKGWLGLFAVKEHDVFKAVQFGYIFGNTFHALQEGFDPDFEPGTGNALRHHAIETCINEGVGLYDFLGGWTDHKRRWGAELRPGHDVFAGSNKLKSRLLFLKEVWPSGRYIDQEGIVTSTELAQGPASEDD